ncbi:MAG: hypothetical protein AB7S71_15785 [Dongiaceae bacterium]
MTHAELCPSCERPAPPWRIVSFLASLWSRWPRRADTLDLESTPRYLLRDLGLSE